MTYLERFLDSLKTVLPEICTDKDLVSHVPNIFKSLPTVHRMRQRKQVPAHFSVEPNFYYLRDDVICWLQECYKGAQKTTSKPSCNKLANPIKRQIEAIR
jgi:hypothetical protein